MRSVSNIAFGVGVLAVALTGAVVAVGTGAPEGLAEGSLGRALPALAAIALVGRVALSVLPPGPLGGHGPRALATTWAASHLLGLAALTFTAVVWDVLALPASASGLLFPWLVVLVLRLATLPGAMVPRHEPRPELPSRVARALPVLVVAAAAVGLASLTPLRSFAAAGATASRPVHVDLPLRAVALAVAPADGSTAAVLGYASWLAAALLAAHGLGVARRAPAARLGAAAAIALTPFAVRCAESPELVAALLVVGGASSSVAWLRRADRRGRALALVAFAALPLVSWSGLVLGGVALALLAAFTPAPSRRAVLLTGAALWALVAWPIASRLAFDASTSELPWLHASPLTRLAALADLHAFGAAGLLVAAGLVAAAVEAFRGHAARRGVGSRELGFTLTLAGAAAATLGPGWPLSLAVEPVAAATAHWARLGVLIVLPLGVLASGLGLARAERDVN